MTQQMPLHCFPFATFPHNAVRFFLFKPNPYTVILLQILEKAAEIAKSSDSAMAVSIQAQSLF